MDDGGGVDNTHVRPIITSENPDFIGNFYYYQIVADPLVLYFNFVNQGIGNNAEARLMTISYEHS